MVRTICIALLLGAAAPAAAQDVTPAAGPETIDGVLVTTGDLTTQPYRVLGPVTVNARRPTIFSPDPSRAKIFRLLAGKARKMGADAVVLVTYGDNHLTMSGMATTATGRAVKFVDPAPSR